MSPTTKISAPYGRLAHRMRNFLFALFRPNRQRKGQRDDNDKGGTPKYMVDLRTIDIPEDSLAETFWDALEIQPEETTPIRETSELVSIAESHTAVSLSEDPVRNEDCEKWFWDAVDRLGARRPFVIYASVQSTGNQNYLADIFDPCPKFHLFNSLPAELRLKIWGLTTVAGLVHFNVLGARRAGLNLDRQVPILLQVCQESRCEGLRLFEIDLNNTMPFFFNPKTDTLLWTRFPNLQNTIDEDITRFLNSSTLRRVRNLAIVYNYWDRILTDERRKEAYTAIRKAPNLEVLTLVDDYFVTKQDYRGVIQKACGMRMELSEIPPEENGVRKVRWIREVQREAKDMVWKKWDVCLMESEILPRRVPEIRLARAFLVKP